MKTDLTISDYVIVLFIASVFGLGIYALVKFMKSKD
jgi:hypothetical protein